jgi:uncharacterized RDD family membrane protein YckC
MKTWHIRVVDLQGRPLSQLRALLRYVLSWMWFLPPLAVGFIWQLAAVEVTVLLGGWVAIWAILARFHPQRQFWHDAMAGTRLVSSQPQPKRK